MAAIYSILAAIVAVVGLGIVFGSSNTVPIFNTAGSTFVNALKVAKPS